MARKAADIIREVRKRSPFGMIHVGFCLNAFEWRWMAPRYLKEWSIAGYRSREAAYNAAVRIIQDIEARIAA